MPYRSKCIALLENLLQSIEEPVYLNYSPILGPVSTWQSPGVISPPPPSLAAPGVYVIFHESFFFPVGRFVNGQFYTKSSWIVCLKRFKTCKDKAQSYWPLQCVFFFFLDVNSIWPVMKCVSSGVNIDIELLWKSVFYGLTLQGQCCRRVDRLILVMSVMNLSLLN